MRIWHTSFGIIAVSRRDRKLAKPQDEGFSIEDVPLSEQTEEGWLTIELVIVLNSPPTFPSDLETSAGPANLQQSGARLPCSVSFKKGFWESILSVGG